MKYDIEAKLEATWKRDKGCYKDGVAENPPQCLRCGRNLNRRLSKNVRSLYVNVYVCKICGDDEYIRQSRNIPLLLNEWFTIENKNYDEPDTDEILLSRRCMFDMEAYIIHIKINPNDYFTSWEMLINKYDHEEYKREIKDFNNELLDMEQFSDIKSMKEFCICCAEMLGAEMVFNMYSQTRSFNVWLQLIPIEGDYNIHIHYFPK